jgi:hypothetical protein
MAQAVEFLPSKPETLIQTPVPPPLKKKRNAISSQKLEETRNEFSCRAFMGKIALLTPQFGFLPHRTEREYISIVLSQEGCGHLFQLPQKNKYNAQLTCRILKLEGL